MCVVLGTRSWDRDIPNAVTRISERGLGFLIYISSLLGISLLSSCKMGALAKLENPLSSQSRLEHPPGSSGCCSQAGARLTQPPGEKFSFWRGDALGAALSVMAEQNLCFLWGYAG